MKEDKCDKKVRKKQQTIVVKKKKEQSHLNKLKWENEMGKWNEKMKWENEMWKWNGNLEVGSYFYSR